MYWLQLFSVWLHVTAATAWIGSMLFFAVVVVPAMRDPAAMTGAGALLRIIGGRYRVFGWTSLAILFVTGAANLAFRGVVPGTLLEAAFWSSDFGRTLARKLLFIGFVLFATVSHDLWMRSDAVRKVLTDRTSPDAKAYRRRASLLGRATLVLSLVVLFFAVQLVRGTP